MKTIFKKTLLALFVLVLTTANAHRIFICWEGQGYIFTYETDIHGNVTITSWSYAGACPPDENYAFQMDRVTGSGSPLTGELNNDEYEILNDLVVESGNPTAALIDAVQDAHDNASTARKWVNPHKLNGTAYNFVYGSEPYLDIFYVSATKISGTYFLNVHSDEERTVTVEYRDIYATLITSESVDLSLGGNSVLLAAPASLSNGLYYLKVITENSSQTAQLTVSN